MSKNNINIGFEYAIIIITPIYGEASAEGASKIFGKEKSIKSPILKKKVLKSTRAKKSIKKSIKV